MKNRAIINPTQPNRLYYLDFLRVLAAFAVIVIHASTRAYARSAPQDVFAFYAGVSAWAVPVFVMISGALFLSRDIPVKQIYSKYIFRIFTAFLFWSFIYALAMYADKGDATQIIPNIIAGHYHLWFMPMIAGLYMAVPLLKRLTENATLTKYLLVMAIVFSFVLPQSADMISFFSGNYGEAVKKLLDECQMIFAHQFAGYFVLGFFMSVTALTGKTRRIIYALGIIGLVLSALRVNAAIKVPMCAVALFMVFKEHCPGSAVLRKIFMELGKYSFGIYLVHEAVMQVLRQCGLTVLSFSPVFSVPVISVLTFIISLAISAILNHIPVLKKYIV